MPIVGTLPVPSAVWLAAGAMTRPPREGQAGEGERQRRRCREQQTSTYWESQVVKITLHQGLADPSPHWASTSSLLASHPSPFSRRLAGQEVGQTLGPLESRNLSRFMSLRVKGSRGRSVLSLIARELTMLPGPGQELQGRGQTRGRHSRRVLTAQYQCKGMDVSISFIPSKTGV